MRRITVQQQHHQHQHQHQLAVHGCAVLIIISYGWQLLKPIVLSQLQLTEHHQNITHHVTAMPWQQFAPAAFTKPATPQSCQPNPIFVTLSYLSHGACLQV
jgi:hypothetical protein